MLLPIFYIKTMIQNSARTVFWVVLHWQKTFFFPRMVLNSGVKTWMVWAEWRIHLCAEVKTGRQARMLMSCMVAFWMSRCLCGRGVRDVPLLLEVKRVQKRPDKWSVCHLFPEVFMMWQRYTVDILALCANFCIGVNWAAFSNQRDSNEK